MLVEAETTNRFPAIGKRCDKSPVSAKNCIAIHATVARAIWPYKTAECWAAAAGRQPRIAKLWLAGGPVSGEGKLALVRQLVN